MARRPDLFQPCPGKKRRAQSASTAWIFTGGEGILEGWCTMLRLGEGRRDVGMGAQRDGEKEGGWVRKEQGAFS